MKILHICLASFYIDNFSYQENLLPKYHKQMGLEVEILASLETFDKNGNITYLKNASRYINEFGIPVTRINYKKVFLSKKLRVYNNVYEEIFRIKPDIIFIHGCQFYDIVNIVKYLKEYQDVKVIVDNHADFSNSARNWVSKNILHKFIWKKSAQLIEPYSSMFYGVLPARVEFLKEIYGIPEDKVELLVMGADDEKVKLAKNEDIKIKIRKRHDIKPDDFLIVTGGKIDNAKKQTLLLMQAVKELQRTDIKLIVFGSVVEDLKEEVDSLTDGEKVQYIGWVPSENSYNYFGSADLVIFPGRHSVFWEQVVGLGIPIITKHWDGTTHINIEGNCEFLYEDSVNEIKSRIYELVENKERYNSMYEASQKGIPMFSYRHIAEKSLESVFTK